MATKKDPRSPRCKKYVENGKVEGVSLTFKEMPETRFELVDVDIFTEDESKNETKAIAHVFRRIMINRKEFLIPARVRCYLAWPIDSSGDPDSLEMWQLPGNVNEPYEHIITNVYAPPKKGPLAIFVGDDSGNIDSDVVGGLGLPIGRHVSFHLTFVERKRTA